MTSNYDEYLMAMKRVHRRQSIRISLPPEMESPRERRRQNKDLHQGISCAKGDRSSVQECSRISTIASMVPDEIICKHYDHSVRSYETALMFIDVSGFTKLCENYTKAGSGGPSRLTQVLNSYIGAMIQEILAYNGDVLKFAGDSFLSMWKKTARLSLHDVVHTAIDCALVIQKNYGTFATDFGVVLKVKVAISAGTSYFSILDSGESSQASFAIIVGQPVYDVKKAEYICTGGDVVITPSACAKINESYYCTQLCTDGLHTKVIGVGATWKRAKILNTSIAFPPPESGCPGMSACPAAEFREFSLRPAVIAAMRSSWWSGLRDFMLTPVLRAVENDEPMDFLSEIRRVVVVFTNIIMKPVTEDVLIGVVNQCYKSVSSVTSNFGGLVNKVLMFDKDTMFLVVFGLRGMKHEDEAQKALQCAFQIKTSLHDHNIRTVSIGVTSGTTYCGVVGHLLRREYTVIGSAVNKAARLMMAYPDKVTCDKETFLRSKLDQEYFKLMESKPLKGIQKPGPIYEYNKLGWHERLGMWRHPLLGRNLELHQYKTILSNALQQQHQSFTRYRDHKFAIAFSGPKLVGKTRLLEECLYSTPNYIRVEKFILTEEIVEPYGMFRLIVARTFTGGKGRTSREICENRIRYGTDLSIKTPVQLYAVNTVFNTRFPLPEKFNYTGNLLDEPSVKTIILEIFKANYPNLWVLAVKEAQNMDDESWRILLLLLSTKTIFVVMTLCSDVQLSPIATTCLENGMIVNMTLHGIDRWYHAALACQLLDVQAIPADLQKVIESASGGMPGWVQNFVIALVQRGALTVVTVPRREAHFFGAIMPSINLLQRADISQREEEAEGADRKPSFQSIFSMVSADVMSKTESGLGMPVPDSENIQMAVLADNYNFDNLTVDMTMDVTILKTYDSLTPFEKMLLKCASVLGDVFSRRMLSHLLQSDSTRNVAQAVAKLFTIRVLECEGGDFTMDTSLVLVHPAPALPAAKPPYCACLGTRPPPNCRDLPTYAFCGYMRFKHSLFRTTTYELLTESHKQEMHARALIFLERYTKRCSTCGGGRFSRLLGLRCENGLVDESEELKRTRAQIVALSAEAKVPGEVGTAFVQEDLIECHVNKEERSSSYERLEQEENILSRTLGSKCSSPSKIIYEKYRRDKRVRSFSSLNLDSCECLAILLSVYCQIIDHCRGAGEDDKLYEAYLEYADISILTLNIPQAVRLLFEVETFVQTRKFYKMGIRQPWVMDFQLAQICSMRGVCMLESGDMSEARTLLLEALQLYGVPFPSTKHKIRVASMVASLRQTLALSIAPSYFIGTDNGICGYYFDDIAKTLNHIYSLFDASNECDTARLAAKLSLSYALRTNCNFSILCFSYGNMISSYRQCQDFSMCLKLEKRVLEMCHRKCGILDVSEVKGLCHVYTNIFLFYVDYGKKMESLEFGLSVMHLMTNLIETSTRQLLLIWMLKLLLIDLRIADMVTIMREFFYVTDYYDLSSETWYYYYAMVILLDTGYYVETYGTCEKFYIRKGDAILRSKTPAAAWNFFVIMWLMTVRKGAWEKSILWEDKIMHIMTLRSERHEFRLMLLVRLTEGLLITLVKEMNNWNIRKIIILENSIKSMFKDLKAACKVAPIYMPRYYLLYAYYHAITNKSMKAYSILKTASEWAKQSSQGYMLLWCEHTRNHWNGALDAKHENFWVEHTNSDNLLDYRDFDTEQGTIIPYTLPLPKDLDRNK